MHRGHRRHRVVAAVAAVVALSLALAGCAVPEQVTVEVPPQVERTLPEETVQQLQSAVEHAMAAAGASGAIVGVWAPWSGSWVAGLGTQSPTDGAEVTADMRFRAARITRPMVCDVLFDVAAAGTVSLDDSVSDYVPGVPDLSDVTLRQLCDGTAGLGSYGGILTPLWLSNPTRVWDPRELASYGIGQAQDVQPGTAYSSSDAGYVLLGLALERATNNSLSALVAEHVTNPLGLDATVLPAASDTAVADDGPVLHGHHSLPGEGGELNCTEPLDITELSASVGYADAGIVSDIDDLGHYVQALAAGALDPEELDRFDDPKPVYNGAPTWYTADGGAVLAGPLVGQFGSVPGYAVSAWSDPNSGLTVAVVLNNSVTSGNIAAYLAWELAAIASKAPPASGESLPEAGLPWTAQQQHETVAKLAVCPIPSAEPQQ
ncbi:serine hydrolase domain-containing protein [Microbacterium sp.]|uniref:serine hydrolase domain-containing protein n=1 Tax=Microbacterium sp. TaxID=51671 RepID=UPI002D799DD5|nr:serine hydrolase domain-containing protein [Microbacterium sp.]HET6301560.1 serine hydrolase domain-containing protein [Microbacterium sp.]